MATGTMYWSRGESNEVGNFIYFQRLTAREIGGGLRLGTESVRFP
jgi:hypothetical protein